MNISETKIKFVNNKTDKLKAFSSITIDHEFVVRDIKIIEGNRGCFVAMPSRKLMDRCPSCGGKNHLRAAYCNDCGAGLPPNRVGHDDAGRAKLHADIAHPINSACRDKMQRQILEAYERELENSRKPGYVAPVFDEEYDEMETDRSAATRRHFTPPPQRASGSSDSLSSGVL